MPLAWGLHKMTEKTRGPADPKYDASQYPMVAVNTLGQVVTFISDLDVVQDIYNKHNKYMTKSQEDLEQLFKPLLKDVFGVMHTNEKWKKQRKACSHMFYKERLHIMAEVFKHHLNLSCDQW